MTILSSGTPALDVILARLPAGLREHLARARDKAVELAAMHGADPFKAGLAALSHDIARNMKGPDLLKMAKSYGLTPHPVEERVMVLLHGRVGAEILQRECGIDDRDVLEAVRWHSTFNRGLGSVAKIAFLADKLDHKKVSRYPFLERIERLAKDDLDVAVLSFLQEEMTAMMRDGKLIHPASIDGRNELLELQKSI
ncbi:MAG: HD superfamily phosphohydrolase YqeK (fused to NMNAT in mycoplasms) [Chloroflexi bacterium]|jgi:predicted HD superfamily hydrolase involved in NAD metabolism|nr:MAG: HD superfamily phosphohydrolase YqeK (fused to NMNAT in mycoplasms) [Chloroflexota bacterium]